MNKNKIIKAITTQEYALLLKSINNNYIVELDGNKINNKFELFNSFSNKIGFPDYFGNNWDAFFDVITDQDFIKNFEKLLQNSDKDRKIFIDILFDLLLLKNLNIDINIFLVN